MCFYRGVVIKKRESVPAPKMSHLHTITFKGEIMYPQSYYPYESRLSESHLPFFAPRVIQLQPVYAFPGLFYPDPTILSSSSKASPNPVSHFPVNQSPIKPDSSKSTAATMGDSMAKEVLDRQMAISKSLKMADPQAASLVMKPYNQEPNTMYWFREKDGKYVIHPFRTINEGDLGNVRWYRYKDLFYAVAV
ncbi:hypothetical protein HI914_04987 [Erysiphe necator]|nr:hypothetical protein HI914_04987 [Erysiphe necator]